MKYIFITGGVVSSLGKGLTAGALGALLEAQGFVVGLQKLDPYLNVDPGTMNPFQHGEVYVLDDGAETDLDLGHYERFTNAKLAAANSVSSGQVYARVLEKERRGDYLGMTVQVIPHVTDEIKEGIRRAQDHVDIFITELGGTIGDIEGLPFLEAFRQFALEVGRENILFIHVTLLPYLKAAGEMKTKPSQQSAAKLREIGIQPDILLCRTEQPITLDMRKKLSLFCNVDLASVIEERDVEDSIYELPYNLHNEQLDALVIKKLHLTPPHAPKMEAWKEVVRNIKEAKTEVQIGLVGKYIELKDAYKSVYEALTHGGIANQCRVKTIPIDAEELTKESVATLLEGLDGIIVPGGFGDRGIEGKILAAHYARIHQIPYFGICLGMQIAVIEYARSVAGISEATSTEFNHQTKHPVIDLMESQKSVRQKGGSMRLGLYNCQIAPETKAAKAYGKIQIEERHRHRFEFNNAYKDSLSKAGLVIAGINPECDLVEMIEIKDHPWFVAVQFHPEFKSKPHRPHPLFRDFIQAAIDRKKPTPS